MTHEEWMEHTHQVLWEQVERQGLNFIDDLEPELVFHIRQRMAENWINYKARTGQLIIA